MGIMNCSRPKCDSTMVDKIINEKRICYICQAEFEMYMKLESSDRGVEEVTVTEMNKHFDYFILTDFGKYKEPDNRIISIDDFLNQ